MKYFTPELIQMGQSNDDAILDEQERLWEEAGKRYVAYLDSIRPSFPPGLRTLDDGYYLHDAQIRCMERKAKCFAIVLQLDTPPQSLLTIAYDLVEEPTIIDHSSAATLSGGNDASWQYDEIEMVPTAAPTWRQAILLDNGWELALHFRDVHVEEGRAVFPSPRNAPAPAVSFVVPQR